MKFSNLLDKIDGSQLIKVLNTNNLHELYRGQAIYAPFIDADVIGIYTSDCALVIEIV